jgi:hypothetical protein
MKLLSLEIGGVCRRRDRGGARAGFVLPARRCVRRGSAFRSHHRIGGADRDAFRACQLVAQASAKIGEIKAGLSAEAIAAIEADHRALLEKATAKAGEITAEETRIATAAPAGQALGGRVLCLGRGGEHVARRSQGVTKSIIGKVTMFNTKGKPDPTASATSFPA